jgi:hypothetical protein
MSASVIPAQRDSRALLPFALRLEHITHTICANLRQRIQTTPDESSLLLPHQALAVAHRNNVTAAVKALRAVEHNAEESPMPRGTLLLWHRILHELGVAVGSACPCSSILAGAPKFD